MRCGYKRCSSMITSVEEVKEKEKEAWMD